MYALCRVPQSQAMNPLEGAGEARVGRSHNLKSFFFVNNHLRLHTRTEPVQAQCAMEQPHLLSIWHLQSNNGNKSDDLTGVKVTGST